MQTFLETAEDMLWLADTHKVGVSGYVVAILYGTEDCPHRVELFAVNDYRCEPTVYVADDSGTLCLISVGDRQGQLRQG
jgi:hypothetical protein